MFNTDISTKALIATLKISVWSARKTDKAVLREIASRYHAEEDHGSFSKLLISKSRLEQIKETASSARKLHNDMTLPWVDGGGRLLPSKDYPDYIRQMEAFKIQFNDSVDDFTNEYLTAQQEGMEKLGEIASQTDYPSVDAIKSKYEFEYTFFPVPDNGDFRVTLSPDFVDSLKNNFDQNQLERFKKARNSVVAEVVSLVSNAISRLKNPDKSSWFKATTIQQLVSYQQDHPMIELLEDAALYDFLSEISEAANIYTVQELRENDSAKEEMASLLTIALEKAAKNTDLVTFPVDILNPVGDLFTNDIPTDIDVAIGNMTDVLTDMLPDTSPDTPPDNEGIELPGPSAPPAPPEQIDLTIDINTAENLMDPIPEHLIPYLESQNPEIMNAFGLKLGEQPVINSNKEPSALLLSTLLFRNFSLEPDNTIQNEDSFAEIIEKESRYYEKLHSTPTDATNTTETTNPLLFKTFSLEPTIQE